MGQAVQELIEIRVENEELQRKWTSYNLINLFSSVLAVVIDEYEKEFEENK